MPTMVRVDTSRVRRILDHLPGNVRDNIRAIAYSIEAQAKTRSPVDTGSNRASIYTRIGRDEGTLPQVVRDAGRIELPIPATETTAHVGPSMEYSIYLEYGTGRQPARPYMTPAVREVETQLYENWGRVVTDGE